MFPYLVPWWVVVIAFFAGGIIGFVITILAIANGRSDPRE